MTIQTATFKALQPGDAGFTLMEILVGMALFTVAMLGVGSLSQSTSKMTGCTKMYSQATYEAGQALEQLFSAQYSAAGGSQYGVNTRLHEKAPGQWHERRVGDRGQFNLRYRVVDDAILEETKSIQMNVDYTCGGLPNQNIRKDGVALTGGTNKSIQIIYLLPLRR